MHLFFYRIATVECFVVGPFDRGVQVFPWVLTYVGEFGKGEFDLGVEELCIKQ